MVHTKQPTHSEAAASLAKKGHPTQAQWLNAKKEKLQQPTRNQNPKLQGTKECHHNLQAPQNKDSDQELWLSDKSDSIRISQNFCWDVYHFSIWSKRLLASTRKISIFNILHLELFKRLVRPTWYHYLRMHRFVLFMWRGRPLWRRTFGSWDESEEKFNMSLQLNYTHPSFFQRRYVFDDENIKRWKNRKIWKTQKTSPAHFHVDKK